MDKKVKKINKWSMIGFFWISIIGSLLHFAYEWSGKSPLIGALSPVNESVWEHLKLGYTALLFYILIEYWFVFRETNSYFIAKSAGIIAMNLFIVIAYYAYTMLISNEDNMFVNIGSFIIGALICQLISAKIMKSDELRKWNSVGLMVFILLGVAFVVFTFYPPNLPIFKEPNKL